MNRESKERTSSKPEEYRGGALSIDSSLWYIPKGNIENAMVQVEHAAVLLFGESAFILIGGIICIKCTEVFSISVRDLKAIANGDFRCPKCYQRYQREEKK